MLDEYQLVYITRGRGLFTSTATSERQVCRGRLMLLFPGQWHTYHPYRQSGWDEYYVGFNGPIADGLLRNGFLTDNCQILDVGASEELVTLFRNAIEVAREDKNSSQQLLAGIVMHIIGMVLSLWKNKLFEMSDIDQKIEQAKIIMNEQVEQSIDMEELAMRLNISYSWFRKVFKDYTGYAPAKYFQELKLRRAKQLLVGSSLTVKEIAYRLHYASTEHFLVQFKKHATCTPTEYRQRVRKT